MIYCTASRTAIIAVLAGIACFLLESAGEKTSNTRIKYALIVALILAIPALLLAVLTGTSAMVFLIARLTCLQQCTPDPVLGRTYSIFLAVEGAAGLAGTAIGGVLVTFVGFTSAVAAAAAVIACAALILALPATAARSAGSRIRWRTSLSAKPPR